MSGAAKLEAGAFTFKNPFSRHDASNYMGIRVVFVDRHRNGVGGNGFHVVEFFWPNSDGHRFIATVFSGRGNVAVVALADLSKRWRGDDFEPELRAVVKQWEAWGRK